MSSTEPLQKLYAEQWCDNSAPALASQGLYEWMSNSLNDKSVVLDIGCGSGHGAIALAKSGHSVVTIEENPCCIAAAQNNLTMENISHSVVARDVERSGDSGFDVKYSGLASVPVASSGSVIIVQGDAYGLPDNTQVVDPSLIQALLKNNEFNAVTCWLMGTHRARVPTPEHATYYRLYMENRIYAVAQQVLSAGGLVNFVNRFKQENFDDEELKAHREMAEITDFQVANQVRKREYHDPGDDGGVQLTGEHAGSQQMYLGSITAIKRQV